MCLVHETVIAAGELLLCSSAMAYDGADKTEPSQQENQQNQQTQQQYFHPGLANIVYQLSKDSALARLRLSQLCGSPNRRADPGSDSCAVDTQLYRPFHYCSDLLSAEEAAEVASDPLTLEDCKRIAQV
jgi:hypothetical protein